VDGAVAKALQNLLEDPDEVDRVCGDLALFVGGFEALLLEWPLRSAASG
jgi:hypothetical protein